MMWRGGWGRGTTKGPICETNSNNHLYRQIYYFLRTLLSKLAIFQEVIISIPILSITTSFYQVVFKSAQECYCEEKNSFAKNQLMDRCIHLPVQKKTPMER